MRWSQKNLLFQFIVDILDNDEFWIQEVHIYVLRGNELYRAHDSILLKILAFGTQPVLFLAIANSFNFR